MDAGCFARYYNFIQHSFRSFASPIITMHSPVLAGIVTGLAASTFAFPTTKSLRKRTSRTSAPSGCLTVGSSGNYSTISEALSALGDSTDSACIYISSGTYSEQLAIDYGGPLILYGETSDTSHYASNTVLITNTISSSDAGSLDASATVDITASAVSLYNLNITNGYGSGSQAVALDANADQLAFYACAFSGYQDTLYAKSGTQYYAGCLIEGMHQPYSQIYIILKVTQVLLITSSAMRQLGSPNAPSCPTVAVPSQRILEKNRMTLLGTSSMT